MSESLLPDTPGSEYWICGFAAFAEGKSNIYYPAYLHYKDSDSDSELGSDSDSDVGSGVGLGLSDGAGVDKGDGSGVAESLGAGVGLSDGEGSGVGDGVGDATGSDEDAGLEISNWSLVI
ncbi:MAG: hypothetical protein Q8P35_02575 [Candidatus Yanofskybacteria bacterium]|nr:hypothetical protein [Candidatus Yanofskybacteria bacterium]